MLTLTAIYAALIFAAAKLSESERTRELGRSVIAGLVGLSVRLVQEVDALEQRPRQPSEDQGERR